MKNNRILRLTFLDSISSIIALYAAFLFRFEFAIPNQFFVIFIDWLPFFVLMQPIVFYFYGLYARIWRYTSLFDLYAITSAAVTSCCIATVLVFLVQGLAPYPRSVILLYFILNTILVVISRLSVRIYFSHYHGSSINKFKRTKKRLLLIGAGKTGEKIAREIRTTARHQYEIVGFVDDDSTKLGGLLHGKKIFCDIKNLLHLKIKYDEVLITAPSVSGDQMRHIIKICEKSGKRYRTVPSLSELIDKEVTLSSVRDVSFADLLGREEVKLDMNSIHEMIKGKRVLITGAGGSIGSELVRQCILFDPAEIICLDINEEKIYNLDRFSENNFSKIIIQTVLASIKNMTELEKVFIDNRPQIVFHAAAYKHVPIQELHPWTSVKTNILGTKNVVTLSDKYSVNKFVLVSTDKAVNPVNVMGATKRVAEKLIQSYNQQSKTTFMAVRFGNVLGSSGSAIPTFQKQINKGGPITITHPEMTRYFMSIQEASQLILQSSSLGRDGEVFLLEMGRPIKILQMAKDLIRLSGFEPEVDIPIVFTGLRPGEKLYEELQLFNEKKLKTNHKKIMILKEKENPIPWMVFEQKLKALINASKKLDSNQIQLILKDLLPTYRPRSIHLSNLEDTNSKFLIKGEA